MWETIVTEVMDAASAGLTRVTSPGHFIYWPYLITSFLIAVGVVSWFALREGGGRQGLLRRTVHTILDPKVWFHRSAIVDYICFVINALLGVLFRVVSVASGAVAGGLVYAILVLALGSQRMTLGLEPDIWIIVLYTLFILAITDFASYAAHYLTHRVPLLWEFHKVHHSAQVMTPITQYRVHPLDIMFLNFFRGIAVGTATSLGLFLFGSTVDPISILGLNAGTFLFYVLGANLRHSHIWLPYPRWLSHILISPAQHQIHHSSLPQHHDANFGVMFALWDWLFGSLYVPKEREQLVFGLHEGEDAEYQTVKNFYLLPLQKAWRLLRGGNSGQQVSAAAGADRPDGQ